VIPGLQRREVRGFSFFVFFSLSGGALWGFGNFWEAFNSRTVEFFWLDSCAGVGSCRVSELGRESRSGPLASP
jgi:hypothetical protein